MRYHSSAMLGGIDFRRFHLRTDFSFISHCYHNFSREFIRTVRLFAAPESFQVFIAQEIRCNWINKSRVTLCEHDDEFLMIDRSFLYALPVARERSAAWAQKLRQRTKQEIKETGKARFDKAPPLAREERERGRRNTRARERQRKRAQTGGKTRVWIDDKESL